MSQAQAVRRVRCEYAGKRCVTLTLWRERGAEWFGIEVDGSSAWSSADTSDNERRWSRPYFDGLVAGLNSADDEGEDAASIERAKIRGAFLAYLSDSKGPLVNDNEAGRALLRALGIAQ